MDNEINKEDYQLPPWAEGPFEIIRHANEHLKLAGDADRRIALIGFDNAIEICIDVFISLHPKARGGIEISKDKANTIRRNYHTKLEFFYGFAKEKKIPVEIPMEHIIWYHQLRNNLYHSGSGIVPEDNAVKGAQAAALLIFRSLFDFDAAIMLDNAEGKEHEISTNMDVFKKLFKVGMPDLAKTGTEPPNSYSLIIDTLRTQGHVLLMKSKKIQNRFYRVCELPDGIFGILIVEWNEIVREWQNVTAFTKSKMKNIDQVQQYLYNAGGAVFNGELPQPFE